MIRPRRTFLRSMTYASFSRSIPSLSWMNPPESLSGMGFARRSSSLSTVYCATLHEHAEADRRVEAESALVRTDRAAHLDAEPAADLDVAAIVDPRDPEHHDAFRLDRALEDLRIDVARVPSERQFDRLGDLLDRLMELRLARVLRDEL